MSLTNENNSDIFNFKPKEIDDIVDKLHKEQENKVMEIRAICPTCRSKNYVFAFDKYNFHYVQCQECMSLYIQNPLNDDDTKKYNDKLDKELYSNEKYNNYLNNIINTKSFDISLMFSRLFNKNKNINIAYLGNKQILYEKSLESFNINLVSLDLENIDEETKYDLIIVDNMIEKLANLDSFMNKINSILDKDGFMYITMRTGSGIDILTLWEDSKLYPIEHSNLLSIEGIKILLKNSKFSIKEINTPGVLDIDNILQTKSKNVPRFLEYLNKLNDVRAMEELQSFLQKNMLSSFATIIAQKHNT